MRVWKLGYKVRLLLLFVSSCCRIRLADFVVGSERDGIHWPTTDPRIGRGNGDQINMVPGR